MTRPAEDREALSGVVERVVFHNEENGFAVLRVRVRGSFQPATVVGRLPLVSQGETIRASGAWKNDPNHGVQFRADRLAVSPPDSLDGIRRYLGSGRVHGVGPKMAKRLVKAFGEDVFEVIENEPERLKEVPGIGPKRAKRLSEGFKDQKAVREIMVFLQTHGLGSSRAARIYRTYGADAATLLTEDPYRLARDIRGIGFRIADSIGASLGKDREGLPRARAGLGYTLEQARGAGHCGLPRDELLEQAQELLKIPQEILVTALGDELEAGRLAATRLGGEEAIFLPHRVDDADAFAGAQVDGAGVVNMGGGQEGAGHDVTHVGPVTHLAARAPDLERVLPDECPGNHGYDRVVLVAARAVNREVAADHRLEAVLPVQGTEGEFAHQLGPAVHVVGVVGRADLILGEKQPFCWVGLQMVRVDAAGRGVNDFFDTGETAGSKNDAIEEEIRCAVGLVEFDVSAAAVIGGEVKDSAPAGNDFRCDMRVQEIGLLELDRAGVDVAADVGELAAAEIVNDADPGVHGDQRVDQVGADERGAAGDQYGAAGKCLD